MEKQILSVVKWTKIIGLTTFILGVIIKSLYFYKILSEIPAGSNAILIIGLMTLASSFLIKSNLIKLIYFKFLNISFSIFLIGSLFIFMHWPGGEIMLMITVFLIPILIFLIYFNNRNNQEIKSLTNDLFTIIVVLFVIVFFFISSVMHFNGMLQLNQELSLRV